MFFRKMIMKTVVQITKTTNVLISTFISKALTELMTEKYKQLM